MTLGGAIVIQTDAGLTWLPHSDYEICQHTGLISKNGLGIYEGDIIEVNDTRTVIEFRNGQFGYKRFNQKNDIIYFPICLSQHKTFTRRWDIQIIGNIYENPELLKTNEQEQKDEQ